MTRLRLRPTPTADELAVLYPTPHDHTVFPDHVERVRVTIELAKVLCPGPIGSAADLSAGDATILNALDVQRRYLGDFAEGYEFHGPIEDTIHLVPEVDLFVCCETVEHVDDPDVVLKAIRAKARALVVSTPIDNWNDQNLEHLWAWSYQDVVAMLADAGWAVAEYALLDFRHRGPYYYHFAVLGCR